MKVKIRKIYKEDNNKYIMSITKLLNKDIVMPREFVKYINYEDNYDDEHEYLEEFNILEDIFNKHLRNKKKEFYQNNTIYRYSKLHNNIPDWMLERLLIIDICDCFHRFSNKEIIKILLKNYK